MAATRTRCSASTGPCCRSRTRTSSRPRCSRSTTTTRAASRIRPAARLYAFRIDYNVSSNNRLFFRGNGNRFEEGTFDWTYEAPDEYKRLHDGFRNRYSWSFTGNWTRVFGATVIDSQVSGNEYLPARPVHGTGDVHADGFRPPCVHGRLLHGARHLQIARGHDRRLSADVERRQSRSDDHERCRDRSISPASGRRIPCGGALTFVGRGARPSRVAIRQDLQFQQHVHARGGYDERISRRRISD